MRYVFPGILAIFTSFAAVLFLGTLFSGRGDVQPSPSAAICMFAGLGSLAIVVSVESAALRIIEAIKFQEQTIIEAVEAQEGALKKRGGAQPDQKGTVSTRGGMEWSGL